MAAVNIHANIFAREYLRDFNRTRAYLRATSQKSNLPCTAAVYKRASVQAVKLMKQPEVRAAIAAAARARLDTLDINGERVLQEWARIAFFDPRDLLDADGKPIPLEALPTHVATALHVKLGPNGKIKELTPHDKDKATELLGKYLQLLKDAPPPPQFQIDLAALAKMRTEDLEQALKHAEAVQALLGGSQVKKDA